MLLIQYHDYQSNSNAIYFPVVVVVVVVVKQAPTQRHGLKY